MSALSHTAPQKIGTLLVLATALRVRAALAGAVIKVDEDLSIDVGAQMQALAIMTETDLDGDGIFDAQEDFKVRRARLRLGANITDYVRAFLQTETGSNARGTGSDMRVIDAWLSVKAPNGRGTLYMGEHMAPANRQNLTASSALMTLGIGASYDLQNDVGACDMIGYFDYNYYSLDAFADLPMGPGALTAEASHSRLDLDNAMAFDAVGDHDTPFVNPRQSQGDGYYVQAGYFWNAWQPWLEFEKWNSNDDTSKGSYDMYRIGVSYFLKGHNANVKLGFEQMEAEAPLGNTVEDSIDTVTLGLYLKY